ncbi:SGNH/GDSL hydrolase family protein [Klebsiella variicola]|uniref:SGNH/GDSL hydrolase family protein n=1 Tax=Klebsiella variicola TaxID=244366 RepID=UPI0023A9739B|nr:GDSL-type esterase/lipase family protein [Klebsiella variicola]
MAEFIPPLGTADPQIFMENVRRLDQLMQSSELTFPDRAGELLYTWRGIHQTLIPLSKQYMTLAAAQADIVNIPVGSTTYYRSPDDSALAVEVINNAGTLQPTGRKMPSQQAVDAIIRAVFGGLNVLFDPLCELLLLYPSLGGKTHIPLGSITAAANTNSRMGFPAIVAGPAAGGVAARTAWLADCGLKAGDVISTRVTAWYANAGGRVAYVFRDTSGTQIGTQGLQYATATGVNSFTNTLTIPAGAVRLDIRVENTANAGLVELAVVFMITANASANLVVPGRPLSPYPVPLSAGAVSTDAIQKKAVTVEKAAFFVPGVNLFDKSAVTPDSYVDASTGTIKTNVTYDASDFIPVVTGNAYTQHYAHQTAYYDANKNYLSGEQASTSPATPRTLTIPTGAAYIRMTVAKTVLNTMQFEKGSEATGYQPYAVQLDPLLITQTNTAVISDYVERAHQIRVGRMKLSQLESGASTILTVGIFGDSWPTQPNRFSQPLAKALRAKYGAGSGVGWTSFGRHATSESIINANVFSPSSSDVLKTLFTWMGNWLFSYSGTKNPTNSSPDTAVVTSSTPGDKLKATVPGTSDGGWSTCRLGYVGTGDGVIRYNWDGGAWTTLTVQGSGLQFVDINPPATVNASNVLNIENVSGTVSLCGLNPLATGAGVRVHKLGASGSSLASWLTMDANDFAKALTELALDTVIILTGTNDQRITGGATAFENNLRSFIARIRAALPGADILFVMPCENERTDNPTTMATMAKRARAVTAELGCAFINLQYIFGDNPADYAYGSVHSWFAEDGIHPDPATGGHLIKDAVFRALTNR